MTTKTENVPTPKELARIHKLIPNGVPRYVRCYDNGGETMDRYTIVYTGNYKNRVSVCEYLGCSEYPFHGVGIHGESNTPIDYPKYSHLGKRVDFKTLPPDVKKAVIQDYKENWELPK
jgi:hypothetical protein